MNNQRPYHPNRACLRVAGSSSMSRFAVAPGPATFGTARRALESAPALSTRRELGAVCYTF
jgi:hypothetical protein